MTNVPSAPALLLDRAVRAAPEGGVSVADTGHQDNVKHPIPGESALWRISRAIHQMPPFVAGFSLGTTRTRGQHTSVAALLLYLGNPICILEWSRSGEVRGVCTAG